MKAGIAIGSNLGNKTNIFLSVIKDLKKIHRGPSTFLSSSFYETEPLDCPKNSPLFLNAVVQLETEITPLELLQQLQSLEIAFGRPLHHAYNEPRTLDLDLLYCYCASPLVSSGIEFSCSSDSKLILPHPRIRERAFVLAPLAEIAPNLVLPGWEKTTKDYLFILNNK